MKHYNFKKIREKGDCVKFAVEVLGATVAEGRCAAVWRNGTNPESVVIDAEKWFDHAANTGGGIIELCAVSKFGSTDAVAIQNAQEFLGEWLNLDEVTFRKAAPSEKSRYNELLEAGYIQKAKYDYVDLSGEIVYSVYRLEHPEKKKEFVQGTPGHWGISGITPIPYNWPAVNASDWCVIVEGEKDVETLKAFGIPATTNSGGAKKWRPEFANYFEGKKVIILPDNDAVGMEHAELVARDLHGHAAGIKIVRCSNLPKGDVTDYFEKEGGSWEKIAALAKAAPEYEVRKLPPVDAAKEANKTAFRNFILEEKEVGRRKIKEKIPRQINELVNELHIRLLGAPFRVGEQMFDQDRETGEINYIYDTSDLFAWIARKTRCLIEWDKGNGCITKQEFFSALKAEAKVYNSISFVPNYPSRDDVFYSHPPLPEPSADHKVFRQFVDFFNPTDDINRSMLAAFMMAPIFYKPMTARPLWIIDSPDRQGSGKSKIPEMAAFLYGENLLKGKPIDVSLYDLDKNYQEVVKRIISTEGRNSRILRIDNVTGILRSSNLAMLVTSGSISGRASYGRGEESRPNDLTYVVTVNGATVDTDIASRAYYIFVAKPEMIPNWTENVVRYIQQNRIQIFADIIDIIQNHRVYDIPPSTRTPEFETRILQAVCGSPEQYQRAIETMIGIKEDTNIDDELARRIEEEIMQRLLNIKPIYGAPPVNPQTDRIFIRSYVLEHWFKSISWIDQKHPTEIIRNMARTKKLAQVDPKVQRWPHHDSGALKRRSGILWNWQAKGAVRVIGLEKDKTAIEIEEG